jgi:acetyl-CoA carboxylase/biotin carboxylase 1
MGRFLLRQVAWNDPADPTKGYEYCFLSDQDYHRLCAAAQPGAPKPVKASRIIGTSGSTVWVVSDIIGLEDGLGVECLSGSGAIAGCYRWGMTHTHTHTHTVADTHTHIHTHLHPPTHIQTCTHSRP